MILIGNTPGYRSRVVGKIRRRGDMKRFWWRPAQQRRTLRSNFDLIAAISITVEETALWWTFEKSEAATDLMASATRSTRIFDSVVENTRVATEAFFASYAENPDPKILAAWLAPRAWREIDERFLLNEQICRYGMDFERKHITLLAKQSFQEAEHYEMVGKAIELLGMPLMSVSTQGEAVERLPVGLSRAASACRDRRLELLRATSASGSFEPTFKAGEKHGFDEVVRIYKQIEIDEKFHVGLGRQVLAAYAKTDEDRYEIIRAMRGMRDIAWKTFTPEFVAQR